MKVSLQDPDSNGKRDAVVEFKDSQAVMEIFSQIPKASCTYAVEINPPIKSVSIISSFNNLQFQMKKILIMYLLNFIVEKYELFTKIMIMQGRL